MLRRASAAPPLLLRDVDETPHTPLRHLMPLTRHLMLAAAPLRAAARAVLRAQRAVICASEACAA